MASNQNVNKVVYAGTTLIDLTGDDVTAGDVLSGKKFHLPSGAQAIGTMSGGGGEVYAAISVTYPTGSVCTATNGTITLTAADTSGQVVFGIPEPSSTPETWIVSCTDGTLSDSATISITSYGQNENVKLSWISATFGNNSWAIISEVASEGTGDTYWDIGDKKTIRLNGAIGDGLTLTNYDINVFILDFNHKDNNVANNNIILGGFKTNDNKDVVLVDSKDGSVSTSGKYFNMNHTSNSNTNGWKGCDLRYDILGTCSTKNADAIASTISSPKASTLMAALPNDFRSVLKMHTHYTNNVGKTTAYSDISSVVDAGIFLLSEYEVHGSNTNAFGESTKQSQMTYYKNGASKTRYKYNSTSTSSQWWNTSPIYTQIYNFCFVNPDGSAGNGNATVSRGLAPAFKV